MIGSFSISVSITSRIESKLFNTGVCRVAREQPNNIFTSFTAEKSGEKKDTANVWTLPFFAHPIKYPITILY